MRIPLEFVKVVQENNEELESFGAETEVEEERLEVLKGMKGLKELRVESSSREI